MILYTIVFLIALVGMLLTNSWLSLRQIRHVRLHSSQVPEAFSQHIQVEEHLKAADYTHAKTQFGLVELFVSSALLLAWTLGGGLETLDQAWRQLNLSPLWTGAAFLISALALFQLVDLPMDLYRTFKLEQRFGFNRTSLSIYAGDQLKSLLLLAIIGIPIVLLILWIMSAMGQWWWFYVWLTWISFTLLMLWAYPAFIAPLFNKFSPLTDKGLEQRITALLNRCGFTSQGIYVMDGSKRSSHGNAYFTGLGNNKRIVFYDTLLKALSTEQIEAVLAHELGHFKHKHIRKRLISMQVITLLSLALLGWLLPQPEFYRAFGMTTPSTHAALVLFILLFPVFSFFVEPISAKIMRKHEFEADTFAAQQTNATDLIQALVQLYKENASTLTPDPLYSAFHDSHPPAPVRIAHLQGLA